MAQLVAALPDFIIFSQNTIHAAPRTQISTFVYQCGIHFAGCAILKAFTVEFLPNGYLLCLTKGTW